MRGRMGDNHLFSVLMEDCRVEETFGGVRGAASEKLRYMWI